MKYCINRSHRTSYTFCDYCRDTFCSTRHFCITCQLPSFNNQIDVCPRCLAKNTSITSGMDNFTHDPSHTLFKSNRRILGMEKPHLIPRARDRSKRVKRVFRGEGTDKRHHGKVPEASKGPAPQCIHCSQDISLPCWVCTVCRASGLLIDCNARSS